MQQQRQPERAYLYSLQGFQFCDLLLSQGQYQEVQKRAHLIIEIGQKDKVLLEIGLGKLSLGRAFLLEAAVWTLPASRQYFDQARAYLQQAVAGLREAGYQHELPRGLFTRAACYRSQNEFTLAWDDLKEAREIAERGEMKLHLADYHLEACRLEIKEQKANSKRQADEHLNIAAEMIERMGYGRRKAEVDELRRELKAF